jgi:hypothetical protein
LCLDRILRRPEKPFDPQMLRSSAEMEAHGIEIPKDPRAQRRGLARGPVDYEDLLYFTGR